MSVFIFSTISQIMRKQRFMYFEHKHVETGPNYSYKLATFFKYHIPLNGFFKLNKRLAYAQKKIWLNQQNFGWFNHSLLYRKLFN